MARGKKKNTMDYATAAFRFWARRGCPTYDEAVERIYNKAMRRAAGAEPEKAVMFAEREVERAGSELCDVLACDIVFREFERTGNELVCQAVREVYMVQPYKELKANDITHRVLAFALKVPLSERQVYRYLARAREAFALVRGLRQDETEEDW